MQTALFSKSSGLRPDTKDKVLLTLICALIFTALLVPRAYALDIANIYPVDTKAISGDILTDSTTQGLIRSSSAYDNRLFGIVEDDPLAVYRDTATPKNRPVVRNGDNSVNVTDFNGPLSVGDYITSSPIEGKGMKATESGEVVGVVTSKGVSSSPISYQGKSYPSSTVIVSLNIEYRDLGTGRSNIALFNALNTTLFKGIQNPEQFQTVVRYIIAGVIALLAFTFGFIAFTRSISKGIEAIGRNPLAKGAIQVSIGLEIILTIITSFAGVALAYIIIKF